MFTGIIQGQGKIVELRKGGAESRLTICPQFILENITDGESIAVNGACLSVETHSRDVFTAYVSAETLTRTTLGSLSTGALVNLERALALGDRLGGHLVSGHIDCLATMLAVRSAGQSRVCRFAFPEEFGVQIIAKGSVALDGVSLTVNDCGNDYLEVNVIPETQKRTSMSAWQPGVLVNMETDIIGKYVQRLMRGAGTDFSEQSGGVSMDMLMRNGFI